MNTIYEAKKYEVHECTNGAATVLCVIVSEDLKGFRLVLPLLSVPNVNTIEEVQEFFSGVFDEGNTIIPIIINDACKIVDVTQMKLVCASNFVGYHTTITNSNTIDALDEAVRKVLGYNNVGYTGTTEGCTKFVNKYDVWNTSNLTPYTKVMVLNEVVGSYIVCPIHNETAQTITDIDQFVADKWSIGHVCVPFHINHELRFAYISKMFSVSKDNLVSRSYNVNDENIRKNITHGIMKVFFGDSTEESKDDVVDRLDDSSVLVSDSITEETQEVVESEVNTTNNTTETSEVEETLAESTEEVETEQVIDFSAIGADGDDDSDVGPYEEDEDLVPEKPVKRYSTHSRKKIPMPDTFGTYYQNLKRGIIKKSEIEKTFHVSPPVVNRWIKEHEALVKATEKDEYSSFHVC